jgi:hypothetical protein
VKSKLKAHHLEEEHEQRKNGGQQGFLNVFEEISGMFSNGLSRL